MKNWEKMGKASISTVKFIENLTWECRCLGAKANLILIRPKLTISKLNFRFHGGPSKKIEIMQFLRNLKFGKIWVFFCT
jgi:hypothetical protein